MKLIATIKLSPTPSQHQALLDTLERANHACNYVAQVAWEAQSFSKAPLQKLVYGSLRQDFGLGAQVVIRVIAKVCDAYKASKKQQRTFSLCGAIPYDSRILTYKTQERQISIWTLAGRMVIPFQAGEHQMALLQKQQGESDLIYRQGSFYLLATCEVEEKVTQIIEDVLGIDLGITNLATDSDGEIHSGSTVNNIRVRYTRLRAKLQSKGTHSAKRLLRKRSGRESRFVKNTNHQISKAIVKKAEGTRRGIALEDLKGIRQRATVSRSQRLRRVLNTLRHSWSFFDLRFKILYKALRVGLPVFLVDPAYTSQRCWVCGHTARGNRKSQSLFTCLSCGTVAHADRNAAQNIRELGRAFVNPPHADKSAFSRPELQAIAFRR